MLGVGLSLCAAVLWGLLYCINESVVSRISALSLIWLSAAITCVALLPFIMLKWDSGTLTTICRRENLGMITLGVAFSFAASMCTLLAIQRVGANTAAILEISYPLFVALTSYFIHSRPITVQFCLGALLIFVGSATIAMQRSADSVVANSEGTERKLESVSYAPVIQLKGAQLS